ncbi:hypothetical protein PQX77_002759 [Marasmius sp. AFHP31]|nr:hypothetical protein PQX77_002759 [Marasmius sp. AFHP31]
MSAQFFRKAQNFRITGGNFNQVQGDQHNYVVIQAEEEELTELDGYYEVKQGAICRLGDIGCSKYPRRWDDGNRYDWEEGRA